MNRTYFPLAFLLFIGAFSSCATVAPLREAGLTAPLKVKIRSLDGTELPALLYLPQGQGPFPAVIALHGCGGPYRSDSQINSRDLEWGKRLAENGYIALYPDSFTSRGLKDLCSAKDKVRIPRDLRPSDVYGALKWLVTDPTIFSKVKPDAIALMGWSNGGSTLLWSLDKGKKPIDLPEFKAAIAFYPGCYGTMIDSNWRARIPIQILMGEKDDWTSPRACKALAERENVRATFYPDSFHDFDAPDLALSERHGKTVGTNSVARKAATHAVLEILQRGLGDPNEKQTQP